MSSTDAHRCEQCCSSRATLHQYGSHAKVAHKLHQDGSQATVHQDGSRATVHQDGSRATVHQDGSRATVRQDGSRATVRQDGSRATLRQDGSRATVHQDGSQATVHQDGSHDTCFMHTLSSADYLLQHSCYTIPCGLTSYVLTEYPLSPTVHNSLRSRNCYDYCVNEYIFFALFNEVNILHIHELK